MVNAKRGEVLWHHAGRDFRLCLTFAALAELEHHFSSNGLAALGERLSGGSLSASDILALLAAGLRGAGETITQDELRGLPLAQELPNTLSAITAMLEAAFGDGERANPETSEEARPFPGRR